MDKVRSSLDSIWKLIDGKKTYIVSAVMIIYAVVGYWGGQLDAEAAKQVVLEALAISDVRHAISKS